MCIPNITDSSKIKKVEEEKEKGWRVEGRNTECVEFHQNIYCLHCMYTQNPFKKHDAISNAITH